MFKNLVIFAHNSTMHIHFFPYRELPRTSRVSQPINQTQACPLLKLKNIQMSVDFLQCVTSAACVSSNIPVGTFKIDPLQCRVFCGTSNPATLYFTFDPTGVGASNCFCFQECLSATYLPNNLDSAIYAIGVSAI